MQYPRDGKIDPKFVALGDELRPGERVHWKSAQQPKLDARSFAIFLFAVPWTAFSLFWIATAFFMTSAMDDPTANFFPLFGLPFLLIGIGMMAKPFLGYLAAKRTVFAVTNERIIRLYKGKGVIFESVPAARIGKIKRSDAKDGRGTLEVSLTGVAGEFEPTGSLFMIRNVGDVREAEKHARALAK